MARLEQVVQALGPRFGVLAESSTSQLTVVARNGDVAIGDLFLLPCQRGPTPRIYIFRATEYSNILNRSIEMGDVARNKLTMPDAYFAEDLAEEQLVELRGMILGYAEYQPGTRCYSMLFARSSSSHRVQYSCSFTAGMQRKRWPASCRMASEFQQPDITQESTAERARTRADFLAGRCRCLVATTALAMGVNLPATHVFVRDTTFYGFGKLSSYQLLQILGRAGRGDRAGIGVVLVRPRDDWEGAKLAINLREAVLPSLRSSFDEPASRTRVNGKDAGSRTGLSAATLVAACLARSRDEGIDSAGLSALLGNTLGGRALVSRIDAAVRWLSDPCRVLAYCDEHGRFHLTVLGTTGVRAMLPITYLAGIGQLVRDLISVDPEAKLLERWSALDHLFLCSLMSDRAPTLRCFSESLAGQIDGWMESRRIEDKSLLFSEWVMGTAEASKADELMGSLGLDTTPVGSARKRAYMAMLTAAVLDERSREYRPQTSNGAGASQTWTGQRNPAAIECCGSFPGMPPFSKFAASTTIFASVAVPAMTKFEPRNACSALCAIRPTI
jgi:hypothetical protein